MKIVHQSTLIATSQAIFLRYLPALQTSEGKRFGPSTYNSRRSSLHHLFTIYNKNSQKSLKRNYHYYLNHSEDEL